MGKIVTDGKFFEDRSRDFLATLPMNYLYNKEVFFTDGVKNNKPILFQMVGNLGGHPNDYEFGNDISIFVLGDLLLEKLQIGDIDKSISDLENKLNAKGNYYKDLKIITESKLIEYIKRRSSSIHDDTTRRLIDLL